MIKKRINYIFLFTFLIINVNLFALDAYNVNINYNSVLNSGGDVSGNKDISLPIVGYYNSSKLPVIMIMGNNDIVEKYSYPSDTGSLNLNYNTPTYNLSRDSSTETYHLIYYGFGYLNNIKDQYYITINYLPYFYDASNGINSGIDIEMVPTINSSNSNYSFYESTRGTSSRVDTEVFRPLKYIRYYLGLNVETTYISATLLDFYFKWVPKTLEEVNSASINKFSGQTRFRSNVYIDIEAF